MSRTIVAPLGVSAALLGLSLAGFVSGTRVLASTAGVTNGRLPAAARGSGPDRDVPPSPCTVVVGDTVPGGPLPACRQTAVTVTLGVSCPLRLPLHLVLVVGNHLAMQDHLDEVKRAARAVVNGLDFDDGTMVAVVTLSAQARRQLDLTDRRAPVLAAINRIRLDPINPFVRYYNWIGEAERILEEGRQEGPPALEVIVVYSTGCPSGFESYCTRQIASAGKAKGGGITVIGVCNPNARPFGFPLPAGHCRTLQQMATSGYYHTLQQAGRTAMDLEDLAGSGKDLTVGALTFVESVAPRLRFVPGSAVPPAGEEGADLTFQWHDVSPGSVVTATYRLSPTTPGTATLRAAGSQVRLTDSLGRPGGPWPVARRILTFTTCAVATATPSPTALATPVPTEPAATATPLATATPRPGRLWLPVALHRACRPGLTPLDVVLAMDASTSMDAPSGGTTKLAAAKAAAVAFVELLAPGRDRAAVVVFNHTATVVAPLGSDDAAVEAALAQVVSAPGTNIAAALARSRGVLVGRRRGAAAAMVLLTDGRPDPGTRDRVLVEAALAREAGITVVAVGLGDGVDEDLLGRVASRPELYRSAGDADALAGLYAAMAAELPCPGGAMWQRPWESPPGRPEETGGPPAPDRLSSAPTPIPRPWGDAPSADVEASPIYGAVGGVIGAMATGGDTLYAGVGAKVLRYLPAGPGVAEDAASEVLSSVARDIALEGDRLLVAQGQALLVMDDAGAAGLEPVLGVSTLGRALRVAVEGGFAYVLVEGQPGVLVLDVGGPAPRGAGTGLPQVQGRDLAAGQRRLYVTTGDGLVVADVSMPGTPRMLGEIPGLPGAGAVEVARDRLYVAVDDGVWAFGTSGLAPEAGGFVPTGGRPVAMRVAGNTVVVSTDAGRLVAVDFAVADSPTVLGDVDLADSLGPVAVTAPDPGPGGAGARAYVGGARGIHVVALGADGLAESALVPGFEEAWDVALGDTAVYGALGDVGLGAFTFGPGRLLRLAGMVPLGGSARRVSSSSLHNWAAAVMDRGRCRPE
ncbi:MAG: VWA domain-containing protein, partial [Anaerolineae bacterium]